MTDLNNEKIQRTNFQYPLQFQGDIKNRFFYSLGGGVEKNHLYGITGSPRIGFAYMPVRTGNKIFRGTKLRANVATGVQELSSWRLNLRASTASCPSPKHCRHRAVPCDACRTAAFADVRCGIDQNILGEKLVFRFGLLSQRIRPSDGGEILERWSRYSDTLPAWSTSCSTHYLNFARVPGAGIER